MAIGAAAAAIAAAAAFGISGRPVLAVATAALVAGLLTIAAPVVALLGWIPLVFFGALPRAEVFVHGFPAVIGLLLVLQPRLPRAHRGLGAPHAAVALVVWLGLSLAWAERPSRAVIVLVAWVSAVVCFAVVADVATDAGVARGVAMLFVAGTALSVVLGLAGLDQGLLAEGGDTAASGRLAGGLGDPNTLAAAIVPAGALALGLLGAARRIQRVLLLAVIVVLLVGLVGTQSRGGLIAAAGAVVLGVVVSRGARTRVVGVAVVLTVVGAIAISTSPAASGRLTSGTDTGRSTLWTAAAAMARDHPLTGVGLRNFSAVSSRYADLPGVERYDLLVEDPKAVHNTYLQLLAESGVVGLGLFLLAVGAAIVASLRAAASFGRAGRRDLEALARSVGIGMVGYLAAAFFLTIGSDKPIWILAGLAVGLRRASGRPAPAIEGRAMVEPTGPMARAVGGVIP